MGITKNALLGRTFVKKVLPIKLILAD